MREKNVPIYQLTNKDEFKIVFDSDFEGVIRKCKELRENKEGTWINNEKN